MASTDTLSVHMTARVRAMSSTLLSTIQLDELLESASTDAMIRLMTGSPYETEMAHHQLDAETGHAALCPGPSIPVALMQTLANKDSMASLVQGLAGWNVGLCRCLVKALPEYETSGQLGALEEALDRQYFVASVRALSQNQGDTVNEDGAFIRDLLRMEIDRINLRRLLGPRDPEAVTESVMRSVLPKGLLGERTLRELAEAHGSDKVGDILAKGPYADLTDAAADYAATQRFSRLERQFELAILNRLRRGALRQSIGIAVLMRYAWLKYNEGMNIRLIAQGLSINLSASAIREGLVYV
jgi:vacuolar-type H+-ATPase subunit C/Vma6